MANRELLAKVPLFTHLAAGELDALAALLRQRRYAAGEVVFHEGDPGSALYIIEEGEVKVVLGSAEGKEVILRLLGRGEFFGELALLDGEPRSAGVVAREPSRLLLLQREDFLRFLDGHPRVAASLLAVLSRRLRQTDQLVHDGAFLDVRARLVRVLVELAETKGQPGPEGIVVTSRLTQTELANLVGATRESVNKWLQYYEQQGLVRHVRGQLVLKDLPKLRRELA